MWTRQELDAINNDDWFGLSVALEDGSTPKTVQIWSVGVGDRIFIRSFNGSAGKWYDAALKSRHGHVSAGGVEKDVTLAPIKDEATNMAVDEAYMSKYATSEWAKPMATEPVRSHTIEVISEA